MLRRQLLAWLLLPLLPLLAIDTFVSYYVALRFSERAYDRALVEIARDISLHLKGDGNAVALGLSADARDILLGDLTDRIFFEVTAADGRIFAGEAIPDPPERSLELEVFYGGTVRGLPVRIVQVAVDSDLPAGRPAALVRVAETLLKRDRLAREIVLSVVLPQALLIAVALAVVWLGVNYGLAPLERLRMAVAARSKSDWSPIVTADVPGEVRPLLEATNELLLRLDEALTAQNRVHQRRGAPVEDAGRGTQDPAGARDARGRSGTHARGAGRGGRGARTDLARGLADALACAQRARGEPRRGAGAAGSQCARPRGCDYLGARGAQAPDRPRLRGPRHAGQRARRCDAPARALRQPRGQRGALQPRGRARHGSRHREPVSAGAGKR